MYKVVMKMIKSVNQTAQKYQIENQKKKTLEIVKLYYKN
jgi:hypothetical protein